MDLVNFMMRLDRQRNESSEREYRRALGRSSSPLLARAGRARTRDNRPHNARAVRRVCKRSTDSTLACNGAPLSRRSDGLVSARPSSFDTWVSTLMERSLWQRRQAARGKRAG